MRCLKCGTVIQNGTVCPQCGADMSVKDTEEVSETVQEETPQDEPAGFAGLGPIPEKTRQMGFKLNDANVKAFSQFGRLALLATVLSAVMNFLDAFKIFSGFEYRKYGITPQEVYDYYGPAVKYLDMSAGILAVLFGCLCIWGAISIKKRKKYACALVVSIFAASTITSVAYNMLGSHLFNEPFNKTILIVLLGRAFWLSLYLLYFRLYKHEYVN